MIPEDVAAILKILDRPATDDEVARVREAMNSEEFQREVVRSPDFAKWFKFNVPVINDWGKRFPKGVR